jgi:hypothetical protein
MASADFEMVFEQLKKVLQPFEPHLIVKDDRRDSYSLDAPYSEQYKKEMFFGAVRINKNYVSYHLMSVYIFPDLLDDVSPELRARMQGKSCFNFKRIEPQQLKELARLTRKGLARFKRAKLVR